MDWAGVTGFVREQSRAGSLTAVASSPLCMESGNLSGMRTQ